MRARGPLANRALTGEQRGHPFGRHLVRLWQQVRVRGEDGVRVVAQPGGDDVDGNVLRERQRGGRMPQGVKRPGGDAGRLAMLPEPPG
jgi:hypothetical protein